MNRQANSVGGVDPLERLGVILGGWADGSHGTLAQQLARAIRRSVAAGALADGARLPAERSLAEVLSVSRSTVTAALDELRADGIVVSRRGSGTVVRGVSPRSVTSRIAEHFAHQPGIDLAAGNPPDPSHLPPVRLDVAALLAGGGGPGVTPAGLPALRAALAEHHREAGRHTDPDQVHVTAGAHQAIALTIGVLANPRQWVALEDPNYPGVFDILDTLGARPLPIPSDGAGVLPGALDTLLAEHRPPVVYLQGGPHNPTGRVASPSRRRAVAQVLDHHEVTVVEDCALSDLTFGGRAGPELADLCRRAVVVSVGSFSKVCWGGLRVGWLRGPSPLVERTVYRRLAQDLGASVPSQLLVLQLLGHMEEIAAKRRDTLRATVTRAVEQLGRDLPQWRVAEPGGGSVLWVELPAADTDSYVLLARRHGVHVAPGSTASASRAPNAYVRICVDRPWDLVDAGLQRLRLAWREFTSTPDPVLG